MEDRARTVDIKVKNLDLNNYYPSKHYPKVTEFLFSKNRLNVAKIL